MRLDVTEAGGRWSSQVGNENKRVQGQEAGSSVPMRLVRFWGQGSGERQSQFYFQGRRWVRRRKDSEDPGMSRTASIPHVGKGVASLDCSSSEEEPFTTSKRKTLMVGTTSGSASSHGPGNSSYYPTESPGRKSCLTGGVCWGRNDRARGLPLGEC